MGALFLTTICTTSHPQHLINVSMFQKHKVFRYDSVSLCDANGDKCYQLTVINRHFHGTTALTHPTCVWLDLTITPKPNRQVDLQTAAQCMDCIHLIAVNRRPPRVGNNIVQRELYHFAMVIAQQGMYLGPQQSGYLQMLVKDNKGF
jgi:hypothetical protein